MTTVEGKVFKLILVDTDYFDELKEYLKGLKYFQYGLAIFTKTQKDFDIMYIWIKYSHKKSLNIDRLRQCRIRKLSRLNDIELKEAKDNGDIAWEEGQKDYTTPAYKQVKIDKYLLIDKQISLSLK